MPREGHPWLWPWCGVVWSSRLRSPRPRIVQHEQEAWQAVPVCSLLRLRFGRSGHADSTGFVHASVSTPRTRQGQANGGRDRDRGALVATARPRTDAPNQLAQQHYAVQSTPRPTVRAEQEFTTMVVCMMSDDTAELHFQINLFSGCACFSDLGAADSISFFKKNPFDKR